MKNKIERVKKHVRKHRVAYAVVATATVCTAAHMYVSREWNAFLAEHELTDVYYDPYR